MVWFIVIGGVLAIIGLLLHYRNDRNHATAILFIVIGAVCVGLGVQGVLDSVIEYNSEPWEWHYRGGKECLEAGGQLEVTPGIYRNTICHIQGRDFLYGYDDKKWTERKTLLEEMKT